MRKTKLITMLLMFGMALTVFAGCASGISAPTTEEPTTTTTTAAPTSTPTPTPEPTSTPTPTPVVEEWATDEKLIGTWIYNNDKSGVAISYTFNDDNTGLLVNTYPTVDWQTKEQSIKTTETEIKYSVIGLFHLLHLFLLPTFMLLQGLYDRFVKRNTSVCRFAF